MVALHWNKETGGERHVLIRGGHDTDGRYFEEMYVLTSSQMDAKTTIWEATLQHRWPATDRDPKVLWRSAGYSLMAEARAAAHHHLTERIRPAE